MRLSKFVYNDINKSKLKSIIPKIIRIFITFQLWQHFLVKFCEKRNIFINFI